MSPRGRGLLVLAIAAGAGGALAWGGFAAGQGQAEPAAWTVEEDAGGGLRFRQRHAEAAQAGFLFWGPAWSWAHSPAVERGRRGKSHRFDIDVRDLGLRLETAVERADARTLRYTFDVVASRPLSGIIGGALEFRFEREPLRARVVEPPQLLPDKRGFRWPTDAGDEVRVEFDRALPEVAFEGRDRTRLRCFLVGSSLAAGRSRVVMTVRLPRGGRVVPSLAERLGTGRDGWRSGLVSWDKASVDVSFLNADDRPAGRRGPVRVHQGHLVTGDGRPARFWGTNVNAAALFTATPERIALQARRLAALGFNLVRLHHHDSDWVDPNVFDRAAGGTRVLRPESLRAIDEWIARLNDEGLYVWLDLHVGRRFGAKDLARGAGELGSAEEARSLAFVNRELEGLMADFARAYLDRKSAVTGLRHADNPGLLGVLVVNESDLGAHFGPFMYPGSGRPIHEALFAAEVETARKRLGLGPLRANQTWAPGPGKLVLATLEADFYARALAGLRRFGLGALVAVGNHWGGSPFFQLPPLALGDLVDVHSYARTEFLSANPRFDGGPLAWMAGARVAGKPISVSEWALDGDDRHDRFALPLYVASVAALQGWDALMHFAYQQQPLDPPQHRDVWASVVDPAALATMPAAAVAFRQGHVRPARRSFVLALDRAATYFDGRGVDTSRALRTLVEQSRVAVALPDVPELPWDAASPEEAGATVVRDLDQDFLGPGATRVEADTGEIARDFADGVLTVNTARTQAAAGWLGRRALRLGDVDVALQTPQAAVAVTSLDGAPIATSARLLLSVAARAEPQPGDLLPFVVEPVRGHVALRARAGLGWRPLGADGTPGPWKAGRRQAGGTAFDLPSQATALWFEIAPMPGN